MSRCILIVFLFLSSLAVNGQKKQNLAYYDQDSICNLWPKYRGALDSLANYQKNASNLMVRMEMEYATKVQALKADSAGLTPEVYSVRLQEIHMLDTNLSNYMAIWEEESKIIAGQLLNPLKQEMYDAAQNQAKKKGYKVAYEKNIALEMAAQPGANYVLQDISTLVMIELKIPHAPPKPR